MAVKAGGGKGEGVDLAALERFFMTSIPHVQELGVTVDYAVRGAVAVRLPYHERLVGNPETGVLHGGVITTLVDTVCGIAVYSALPALVPIATLDLRIDYLKPATPGRDLVAEGHCYKVTRNIAFVRGIAHHDDSQDPIANCVSTFMVGSGPKPMIGKTKQEQ